MSEDSYSDDNTMSEHSENDFTREHEEYDNKNFVTIFRYGSKKDEDGVIIYKNVRLSVPIVGTRVVTKIINGLNVFVRLEQKYFDEGDEFDRVVFTEEYVSFDVDAVDDCWEVNLDIIHQICY